MNSKPRYRVRRFLLPALVAALAWCLPRAAAATDDACVSPNTCESWNARYNGSANTADQVNAVVPSPDGTLVFVTGYASQASTGYDYTTIAYDAITGAQRWVARYDGPGHSVDIAYDLVISRDGARVYVTGLSIGTQLPNTADIATVAYDALTGAEVWSTRYEEGGALARSLALSPDGSRLYAAGYNGPDFIVITYDAASGATQRVSFHDAGQYEEMRAFALSPDGSRYFLTATQYPTGGGENYEIATVGADAATGATLWSATYGGAGDVRDEAFALDIAPDGSAVYVVGRSGGTSFLDPAGDYVTVSYDAATGAQRWAVPYDGAGFGDEPRGVRVSPWGDLVYVTGVSWGQDSQWDVVTVAYEAGTGATAWIQRYMGPRDWDWPHALAVAPGGHRVYVTGLVSTFELGANFLTLAYNAATGSQIWQQEWSDPLDLVDVGQDEAYAIGLAADGTRVFVGGSSYRGSTTDYAAVAYRPMTAAPAALLEAQPTSGEAPLSVTFTLVGLDADGIVDGWKLDVDGDNIADYQSATGLPPPTLAHTYQDGGAFTARLTVSDDHGAVGSDTVTVVVSGPAVSVPPPGGGGQGLVLRSFPNPFRDGTTIAFALRAAGRVDLGVYGLRGQRVRTLVRGECPPGRHVVVWDGRTDRGEPAPAGLYLYRLEAPGLAASRKTVRIR